MRLWRSWGLGEGSIQIEKETIANQFILYHKTATANHTDWGTEHFVILPGQVEEWHWLTSLTHIWGDPRGPSFCIWLAMWVSWWKEILGGKGQPKLKYKSDLGQKFLDKGKGLNRPKSTYFLDPNEEWQLYDLGKQVDRLRRKQVMLSSAVSTSGLQLLPHLTSPCLWIYWRGTRTTGTRISTSMTWALLLHSKHQGV